MGDWREQADRRIASSRQGQRFADVSACKGFSAVSPCRRRLLQLSCGAYFSDDSIRNILAYVQAAAVIGLTAAFSEQFRQGVGVTKIITLSEELLAILLNYKSGMTAFADELHKGERTPEKDKKTAAAAYLYQADKDGEWGELRFDFENGAAEIVRLAEWDTVKSNILVRTAIRYIQCLPAARLLKSVVVPFELEALGK
ncbi:MAG: hypothetical protein ACI4IW_02355 [Oscillospiraceae bacterium]